MTDKNVFDEFIEEEGKAIAQEKRYVVSQERASKISQTFTEIMPKRKVQPQQTIKKKSHYRIFFYFLIALLILAGLSLVTILYLESTGTAFKLPNFETKEAEFKPLTSKQIQSQCGDSKDCIDRILAAQVLAQNKNLRKDIVEKYKGDFLPDKFDDPLIEQIAEQKALLKGLDDPKVKKESEKLE